MLSATSLLLTLTPYLNASRWIIAYSGGVDSCVLLHLLVQLNKQLAEQDKSGLPSLLVVHVNHQLNKNSTDWAGHCRDQAANYDVPIIIQEVNLADFSKGSLEDRARKARYQVFESLITQDDVLLMAHHIDDQVETLLMRLLRGSGSRGLGAMPQHRPLGKGQLMRPMLNTSRKEIEHYAQSNGLQWIEDPSNQSSDFDRNFLRLRVLPLLAERWPEYRQTLSRAAALNEESAQLNAELAQMDINLLNTQQQQRQERIHNKEGALANNHAGSNSSRQLLSNDKLPPDTLTIAPLKQLSRHRQKNVIRYWLEQKKLTLPSSAQLQAILDEVIGAGHDSNPLVQWSQDDSANVQVRRFRGELYAMTALPEIDSSRIYLWDDINSGSNLKIEGLGELSIRRVSSQFEGFALKESLFESANTVEIRFRQGGERCQPQGRGSSQTLKKLMQEYAVETWLRERVPLLYIDGQLAAAIGYWVCEEFAAKTEPLIEISWA